MSTLRIDGRRQVSWPSIPHLIAEGAGRGDRLALLDDSAEVTFSGLESGMQRVGRAVVGRRLRPGDRVALWAPNSARWVEAALGALAGGLVVVPLSTRLKGSEAAYALRTSGASLLFTVGEHLGVSFVDLLREAGPDLASIPMVALDDKAAAGLVPWSDFLADGDDVDPSETAQRISNLGQADPAFVVFTSGTTGRPKGAILHHGAMLFSAAQMCDGFDLLVEDRMFVVLPLFHVFGLAMLFASLLSGGRFETSAAVFDADRMVEKLGHDGITVVPGPPTLFDALLASPQRRSTDLSALRTAFIASTAVPGSLVRRLRAERLFDHVVSGYGSTEGLIVSLSRLDEDPETTAQWSGQVLPEALVRVVGPDGQDLPPGAAGELLVRTPSTTAGYMDDPVATAAAIDADGWLHTGDVGIVDERRYLRITDRLKDMFIVGGFNAYPAEIEGLLRDHPAIMQAAVIGVPDARLGEVGAAFVVLEDGCELTDSELIIWARDHMSNYKVPRVVVFVDALPMTASMKVAKFELRELLPEGA